MITDQFIEAVGYIEGAELYGVYSRDLAHAERYAAKHKAAKYWNDLSEMLADPCIDAVYLASPNLFHRAQALACIEAGKHVLIEKPLALTQDDAKGIFDAARAHGVIAMEAMRLVHDPAYQLILDELSRLGAPHSAYLSYLKHSSRYDDLLQGNLTNIFDPRMATGSLMDLGVYPISAAVLLFGMPHTIRGVSEKRIVLTDDEVRQAELNLAEDDQAPSHGSAPKQRPLSKEIDIAGSAVLGYPNICVSIAYSKAVTSTLDCMIAGEAGEIRWQGVGQPQHIRRIDNKGNEERIPNRLRKNQTSHEVGNMEFELEDFVKAIRDKSEPVHANTISEQTLAIVETLREQAGRYCLSRGAMEGISQL